MPPLLIIDFEATCWGPDDVAPTPAAGRRYANEIIEFGCVLLGESGTVDRVWQQYVRPVDHPWLTAFCTELTGIRQVTVDAAPDFAEALVAFRDVFAITNNDEPTFASWGNFDRNMLDDDCAKRQVAYPFRPDNHTNLKAEAKRALGLKRRTGLGRTLALGLTFEGRPQAVSTTPGTSPASSSRCGAAAGDRQRKDEHDGFTRSFRRASGLPTAPVAEHARAGTRRGQPARSRQHER